MSILALPTHNDPDCTGRWEYLYTAKDNGEVRMVYLTGATCPKCGAEREINTPLEADAFGRDNQLSRDLAALSYPGNNHDLAA